VTTSAREIEEIRRRMAKIRGDLHKDVRGVVASAEAATDWRSYVRKYPWISLGAAFGAGLFLVPKRHESMRTTVEATATATAEKVKEAVEPGSTFRAQTQSPSLLRAGLGIVMPFAIRAAQTYAAVFFENWITQKMSSGSEPNAESDKQPGTSDLFQRR